MHLRSVITISLLLAGPLPACDASLGSIAAPETGSEGNEQTGDGDGDGGEPFACIAGQLCPEERSCSNGLCLIECDGDDDCRDDEFCGKDGLCHGKSVSGCTFDQNCAATQMCIDNVCVAPDHAACSLDDYLLDGCASNAVCLDDLDEDDLGICHAMPACDADGTCPIGLEGAVCNTEYIPTKDAVCLIGLCDTVANCPDLWSCVRYDNAVLGYCSDGGFAAPCTIAEHCLSGNCLPLPGVGGGICG